MKTLTSSIPLSVLTLLAVTTTLTAAVPTRDRCRCFVVDIHQPWEPPNLLKTSASRSPPSARCAALGPELEHWRRHDPDVYQTFLELLVDERDSPRGTPTSPNELRPLSTSVLMEMARGARRDAEEKIEKTDGHPLPSAPTQSLFNERIICRTVVEEVPEYHDSGTTLFILGVIIAMAVLAGVAECLTLLLNFLEYRTRSRRKGSVNQGVRLTGDEKRLTAYTLLEGRESSDFSEKFPERVCTAYVVDFDSDAFEYREEDDEDSRPVL